MSMLRRQKNAEAYAKMLADGRERAAAAVPIEERRAAKRAEIDKARAHLDVLERELADLGDVADAATPTAEPARAPRKAAKRA